ncbi:putative rRNA maturation factor [Deinococcus sp. HSC-46F16]|uniref:rRNA maturation RNase YbeY n=1 Tax=Deinococcus sp. HSC-46F16 TaxID=2910968 RepID=UPI00209E9F54|nr:putative rRNA maturation factor [Deinococcus sp. HSC-46F16]
MIDLVARKTPPPGLRPALRSALGAVMRHFGVEEREVTVVLVGDRTIRQLKREHWGEDAPTDVLSFPTWEPGDPFMPPHLGDIIISLDTAGRQAQARGHSLTREVALLASHGLSHLVGHDHPHAEGLGFEEGATGEEWQVFHDAWAAARAALPPEAPSPEA